MKELTASFTLLSRISLGAFADVANCSVDTASTILARIWDTVNWKPPKIQRFRNQSHLFESAAKKLILAFSMPPVTTNQIPHLLQLKQIRNCKRNLPRFSHCFPVYPLGHLQMYFFAPFKQLPPFLHGSGKQNTLKGNDSNERIAQNLPSHTNHKCNNSIT